MTARLAALADFVFRRRRLVVISWIVGAIVLIGVGGALKGEYNADYDTPGSESETAGTLLEDRFDGYTGQEIYVVWKDDAGAASPAATKKLDAFFNQASEVGVVEPHSPIRISEDGKFGSTTLPL